MLAGRQILWFTVKLESGKRSSFSLFSIGLTRGSKALRVGDGGSGVCNAVGGK